MNLFLTLAFLFFIGSVSGWVAELLFRRFLSAANPERKWINPGFCTGPYLPLYGSGLCALYLLGNIGSRLQLQSGLGKAVQILVMGLVMTLIEYITGLVSLKHARLRLWDYSREWGNINGLICPKFSLIWTVLSAVYCLFVHQKVQESLEWLSRNLAFSFFIGLFFGVFLIDICYNAQILVKLRRYAKEKEIVIRYENLKAQIKSNQERLKEKAHFLFPFRTAFSLAEHLIESQEAWNERVKSLYEEKKKELRARRRR